MSWQPEPQLSSGCPQEKFGGTVTQFLMHFALKDEENFDDRTSMQPQVPVKRLYIEEENDNISQQHFSCSSM